MKTIYCTMHTYTIHVGGSKRVPDTEEGMYVCMCTYVKMIMQECNYKFIYVHTYIATYICVQILLLTEKFMKLCLVN